LRALKKLIVACHRWTGVVFCLLFTWWFLSGIFMMYWDYPEVAPEDRIARSPALNAAQVRVSPGQAFAALGIPEPPDAVTLSVFDGHPIYRFRIGGDESKVYADTGAPLTEFPPEMNLRTAASWAGQPAATAKVEPLTKEDQWTVAGTFRALRPLWKYSWPDGQQVYVSESTGEVVQYTTRQSRLGAYLGAIPHWLYFTPLRENGRLWSRVVIWSSGIATIVALLGLIVGLWMYSPRKRYRREGMPVAIPYSGQKRLHMILGLSFGTVACTWVFSGMLSMDPFPVSGGAMRGSAGRRIAAALRGGRFSLESFAAKSPSEALQQAGRQSKVKELEFTSFAGEPAYLAREDSHHLRIIPIRGEPRAVFDPDRIRQIVSSTLPDGIAEFRLVSKYDAYYLDRHRERPLPVILVRLKEGERYYIDPQTARIAGSYGPSAWVNRWLYHALHSWNLPWLYNYRPAWDIFVLALMLGGLSLCVTSVIIGFQLLRRKASPHTSPPVNVKERSIPV
jgi:hypothetical protein